MPGCELCGMKRVTRAHENTAKHQVRAHRRDMRERGYVEAGVGGALIRKTLHGVSVYGPRHLAQQRGGLVNGYWSPRWAVAAASTFTQPVNVRREWLLRLAADTAAQAHFAVLIGLGLPEEQALQDALSATLHAP